MKQMEQVRELQARPAPQPLQHYSTPVADFTANCGEPEYGELVVIKRFNGMLAALDFDCPPSPPSLPHTSSLHSLRSNVRGRYYCNNKSGISFSLANGCESVQEVD